ncbi:hypothetical protein [Sphingomonas sp. NPDC079357]|uniref:hypothetical protein n=1 Tax=Sphingomonas sp. NPDC079357 TaxID=3364518 RepID=UPI00384DF983
MATDLFMLSPLRDAGDHTFKGATSHGQWAPLSGTLGELGQALDVDESAAVDVVRSTPDPWSQARSFADALRRPRRNRGAIAEWRGLLAIVGLAAFYEDRYALRFEPVDLGQSQSRFATVMRRLVPDAILPAEVGKISHGWERPVLVRLVEAGKNSDGTVIGLLNPASLIAGGREPPNLSPAAVPWMRNGRPSDPTELRGEDALPPAALAALRSYLLGLRDELEKLCRAGLENELLRDLRDALDGYAKACLPGIGTAGDLTFDTVSLRGDGLPALYAALLKAPKAKEPPAGTSDCLLRLRSDVGVLPVNGVVLFDPAMATPDRPANTITVWGLTTLADLQKAGATTRADLRKRVMETGYLLVEPSDLFTSVLVKLDDPDQPARIAAHPDSLDDCLLPLSPLALLIATPDQLRQAVALDRNGQVTLTVQLNGRIHTLRRSFDPQPEGAQGRLLDQTDWTLGDVAIWPDFASERWSRYCARIDYATIADGRPRGRFALSGALLTAILREQGGGAEQLGLWASGAALGDGSRPGLDRVSAYADRSFDGAALTRFRAVASGNRMTEVQVATTPFEAMAFTVQLHNDQPAVPAGLALLSLKPVDLRPNNPAGVVAIDFGTTNTVACLDSEEPLALQARIVHPIEPARSRAGGRPSDLTQRFRDFLPPDERKLPTPTVTILRTMDAEGRDILRQDRNAVLEAKLLIHHLMYFQPDYADDGAIAAIPLKEWSTLLNSVQYDLKWSDDQAIKDAAQRYLRQLMLMIAAEWAATGGDPARLSWHFSRPDGIKPQDRQNFSSLLALALKDIVESPAEGAIVPITSEADAAASYILKERRSASATAGKINVIVDIGGGTTDVAIRDIDGKSLGSLSLRVAGGDFFTDHIMANPEVLSNFGLRSWTRIVEQMATESDASLKANIRYVGELLFSGSTLATAIDRTWDRVGGTPPVRALKETAYVFLGGVAWYIGRTIRELIRGGLIDESALKDISVALCGRGAGLFARLQGNDPRAETDISNILLLIPVAAGDNDPAPLQVLVSPHPKIEVAGGMIILARQRRPAAAAAPRPSSRPRFDNEGTGTGPVAAAANEPVNILRRPEIGIEELDLFLRNFAAASTFSVALGDHHRAKLTNGIRDIDREDEGAKRILQPEFATMLKVLVGLIRTPAGSGARPTTQWH